MSIIERLLQRAAQKEHPMGVTLAFLGDSVTQGCFELYKDENNRICTVTEPSHAYAQLLLQRLCAQYPTTPFHCVNVGLSGDCAPNGAKRLARDVLSRGADLAVVCYGLNDCGSEAGGLEKYLAALERIFCELRAAACEVIFLTPNTMNRYVSEALTDPDVIAVAERKAALQNGGYLTQYVAGAVALCGKMGIPVCDCYAIWQKMQAEGTDTTALLSNAINHPTRAMQALFADELLKTLQSKET